MSVAEEALKGFWPEQDWIGLGPVRSPGRATIVSAPRANKWDIRDGYGLDGATTVFVGVKASVIEVRFDLWLPSQFTDWLLFSRAVLEPSAITGRLAWEIKHPVLNATPINVFKVQVVEVTPFVQDDDGMWSCTVKFVEFKKPKPALSKPIAAIPAVSKPVPTAQDAAEVEIQALQAKFAALK